MSWKDTFRLTAAVAALVVGLAAADGSWLQHVSEADRQKANPYAGQADAIAAGGKVFADRCVKCHGSDALGRRNKPSLRSDRVQHATDGEIFWLLKNGNVSRGMPRWSGIPEPTRWQIVAYVKSLGTSWMSNGALPQQNAGRTEENGR
jgi:mono/diheme cytochrome c family protein